jgi:hypothetical protein
MSEKIYACLLRLYPSHFREKYGTMPFNSFATALAVKQGLFCNSASGSICYTI